MQNSDHDVNYRAPTAGYQGKGHIIYEEVQAFSFSQRLNRLRFACYSFTASLILVLLGSLFFILSAAMFSGPSAAFALSIITIVFAALWLLYYLSLAVRRLHDLGRSGWLVFLMLTPFLSIPILLVAPHADTLLFLVSIFSPLFSLYLLVGEGDKGMNRFGTPNSANSVLVIIFGGICWFLSVLTLLIQLTFLTLQYSSPTVLEKYIGKLPQSDIKQLERLLNDYR
jgi:uncharacterized membrane protein YhaH (DUF805 family)